MLKGCGRVVRGGTLKHESHIAGAHVGADLNGVLSGLYDVADILAEPHPVAIHVPPTASAPAVRGSELVIVNILGIQAQVGIFDRRAAGVHRDAGVSTLGAEVQQEGVEVVVAGDRHGHRRAASD
jgi:hypothetical protein